MAKTNDPKDALEALVINASKKITKVEDNNFMILALEDASDITAARAIEILNTPDFEAQSSDDNFAP